VAETAATAATAARTRSAAIADAIARPDVLTVRATAATAPIADTVDSQIDALSRLGRSGEPRAFDTISSLLFATEPRVRAAAYQALGQFLEHDPARLEPHIRRGVTDSDSRVRRRVVLAAAAARGLDCEALLDPLQKDADPQVRRLVKEVLRRMSPGRNVPVSNGADESAAHVSVAQVS
jgi:HEAT repeat protein